MVQAPYKILTVPGWHGSGPGHWQTLWEERNPEFARVEQRDWADPRLCEWVEAIENAVAASPAPVILAAHSLGSLAVARWAGKSARQGKVAAALLVAPPWLDHACGYPANMREFFPARTQRLPFPSVMVASHDDPYISFDAARWLSNAWGSELVDAGQAGHINAQSGHGEWPEGQALLRGLTNGG